MKTRPRYKVRLLVQDAAKRRAPETEADLKIFYAEGAGVPANLPQPFAGLQRLPSKAERELVTGLEPPVVRASSEAANTDIAQIVGQKPAATAKQSKYVEFSALPLSFK